MNRRSHKNISFSPDFKSSILPNMTKDAKVSITDFGQISLSLDFFTRMDFIFILIIIHRVIIFNLLIEFK